MLNFFKPKKKSQSTELKKKDLESGKQKNPNSSNKLKI